MFATGPGLVLCAAWGGEGWDAQLGGGRERDGACERLESPERHCILLYNIYTNNIIMILIFQPVTAHWGSPDCSDLLVLHSITYYYYQKITTADCLRGATRAGRGRRRGRRILNLLKH